MAKKYGITPDTPSKPGQWHLISFLFSVDDFEIDWTEVDLQTWATKVAKFNAGMFVTANMTEEEIDEIEKIVTLILQVNIEKVDLVTEEKLDDFLKEI
jgi:hypothetical protein